MTRDGKVEAVAGRPRAEDRALGAEKPKPTEQRRRFIAAAREAGANACEADFDWALAKLARAKV